jgi:hypothetical protein
MVNNHHYLMESRLRDNLPGEYLLGENLIREHPI